MTLALLSRPVWPTTTPPHMPVHAVCQHGFHRLRLPVKHDVNSRNGGGRVPPLRCIGEPKQAASSPAVQQLPPVGMQQTPPPLVLYKEILDGSFWTEVMVFGIAASAVLAVATSSLALGGDISPREAAEHHVMSAILLATLMPAVLLVALNKFSPMARGLFSAKWDSPLLLQTAAICLVVFPAVDPLLSSIWRPVVTAAVGEPAVSSYVTSLQQASEQGDVQTFLLQLVAASIFTPLWEEVFWRGFFLASLTKVLPLPVAVLLSSMNFALIHLNPVAFLPLVVLSACCDALYVRTFNLLPCMVFHGLWNAYQLVGIFYFHKHDFV